MQLFFKFQPVFELGEIKHWKYEYKVNGYGFREENITKELFKANTNRILFLGDSFTFGQGIGNEEVRFSNIIEKKLSEQYLNKSKYHIYNAGLPGTEPKNWFTYFKKLLPYYKPHYVFAIFFLRDGADLCTSLRCYKKTIDKIKNKYFYDNAVLRHSKIWEYFSGVFVKNEFSNYYQKRIVNSYLGDKHSVTFWIEQRSYLKEIHELCKKNNIDFHLIIFPILYGLESKYAYYDIEKEIMRFARENNMPVFSLTYGFIGHKSSSLWVSPNDQHANEKGNLIAAETLFPYMLKVLREGKN